MNIDKDKIDNNHKAEHQIPSVKPERTGTGHVCPKCDGLNVRRSRRRTLERWLNVFRPHDRKFRCHSCNHRFWASQYHRATSGHATNGHATNGHATNGHATNGHATNGHATNGHATNGHATKMELGQKRSRRPTQGQRFGAWLYRKHSLSISTLLFFILVFSAFVIFVWSALDAV